jgi:hypothetical protein
VRGKQARTRERERVERTGHHKDKKNAKTASQSSRRLLDGLPLVVVRALFGDGDDVLFFASLIALYFSLALFCAARNIWFVQSHNVTYFSFPYSVLFPYSLPSSLQNDQQQWHMMRQQPIFPLHHHYNSTSILHVRRNRDKYVYVGVFHLSYTDIYLSFSFFF